MVSYFFLKVHLSFSSSIYPRFVKGKHHLRYFFFCDMATIHHQSSHLVISAGLCGCFSIKKFGNMRGFVYFCDWKIISGMKKLGIIMAILLHVIVGFAQRSITVGAKIETDFQIWYLDSIVLSNDSTTLKWHVESKGNTYACMSLLPALVDPGTMKEYYMKHVWGIAKEPDKTILKSGEVRSFISTFPRISKSTKQLDYHGNIKFWVKGINLKKGGYSKAAPYIPAKKNHLSLSDLINKKSSWKQLSVEEHKKMLNLSEKMFDLGMSAYGRGKYQDAIEIFTKVSDIDSIVYIGMGDGKLTSAPYLEPKRPYFSNYSKQWIASCYHRLGKDSLAETFFPYYKAVPFDRKLVRRSDSVLINNTLFTMRVSDSSELEGLFKKVCSLDSMNLGPGSYRFAMDLKNLANVYIMTNQIDAALALYVRTKNILDSIQPMNNDQYYSYLDNLAKLYIRKYDYSNALACLKELIKVEPSEKRNILETFQYSKKGELVSLYMSIGYYDKALKILREEINKELPDKSKLRVKLIFNRPFADLYNWYAKCLFDAGYHKEAIRVMNGGDFKSTVSDADELLALGDYSRKNYDDDFALQYYNRAEKIFHQMDSLNQNVKIDWNLLGQWNNQAVTKVYPRKALLLSQRDILSSIALQKQVVAEEEKMLHYTDRLLIGRTGDTYSAAMSNLAWYYLLAHEPDSTILCEKKNIAEKLKLYPKENRIFGLSYLNIGEAYAAKGDYRQALEYTKQAMTHLRYDRDQRRVLANLVKYSYKCRQTGATGEYLTRLYRQNREDLVKFFADLTLQEKNEYLKKNRRFYQNFMPQYAEVLKFDSLNQILYDATILVKGILLGSELEFRKELMRNGNPDLIRKYEQLKINKRVLLRSQMEPSKGKIGDFSALERETNLLEDSLIVALKAYGDYTRFMNYTWKDIQKKLGPNSVAIEFLSFEPVNSGKDSLGVGEKALRTYAALLLKKESSAPLMISLGSEKDFDSSRDKQFLTDSLIWKPLVDELAGVDTVYFSPVGRLHTIPIEYSSMLEGKEVYRLTSTRIIAENSPSWKHGGNAVLYGDIDYDADPLVVKKKPEVSVFSDGLNKMRGWGDDLHARGYSFYPLDYSKDEVLNARKELRRKRVRCQLYSGDKASEESFKALSGQEVQILHLSTHGAYVPPSKVKYRKADYNMNFLLEDHDLGRIPSEDIDMTHSFLMMAGGNNTLNCDTVAYSDNDGILTAQEISQLEFRELKLVVLSACESGLGNISSEGVDGLQRGFKKAGAQAIIMSLRSVKDKETAEFMTCFYRNLVHFPMHKSFQLTVNEMKQKYPSNPENWNSFILLDAI